MCMYIVHVPLIARLEYRLGTDYGMDYPYKLCVMYSIVGKFGEVFNLAIWWSRKNRQVKFCQH